MSKKNILIITIFATIAIAVFITFYLIIKNNADEKRKNEYDELVSDLCVITLDLAKSNPNTIDVNKDPNSYEYVTLETISLLTIGTENAIPMKVENPLKSTKSKPVYFPNNTVIKLTIGPDKSVSCGGLVDLGETPTIILKGDKRLTIKQGEEYIEPGYKATDKEDGDLTSKVLKNGIVDVSNKGEYLMLYYVEDSAGNKSTETRTVIVR